MNLEDINEVKQLAKDARELKLSVFSSDWKKAYGDIQQGAELLMRLKDQSTIKQPPPPDDGGSAWDRMPTGYS